MRYRDELEAHLRDGTCVARHTGRLRAGWLDTYRLRTRMARHRHGPQHERALALAELCNVAAPHESDDAHLTIYRTCGNARRYGYWLFALAAGKWLGVVRFEPVLRCRLRGADGDGLFALDATSADTTPDEVSAHARHWPDRVRIGLLIRSELDRGAAAPPAEAEIIRTRSTIHVRIDDPRAVDGLVITIPLTTTPDA